MKLNLVCSIAQPFSAFPLRHKSGPDGEWKHRFDIATDLAEVRRCAARGNVAARGKQLHRDLQFYPWTSPAF
jgi:hypothetical protein